MAFAEISSALSATGSVIQLLKGLNDATKQAEINGIVLEMQGKLIDLSSKIIAIQAEYDAISKSKADVEKELIEERKKAEQRNEYSLKQLGPAFVYEYVGQRSVPHYICATCYDESIKTVLHYWIRDNRYLCVRDDKHSFWV